MIIRYVSGFQPELSRDPPVASKNLKMTAEFVENTVLTGNNKVTIAVIWLFWPHEFIFDLGYNYSVTHIHLH